MYEIEGCVGTGTSDKYVKKARGKEICDKGFIKGKNP